MSKIFELVVAVNLTEKLQTQKYKNIDIFGSDPFLRLKLLSRPNMVSKNLAFTMLYMLKVLN